jgi:hypothetical protein
MNEMRRQADREALALARRRFQRLNPRFTPLNPRRGGTIRLDPRERTGFPRFQRLNPRFTPLNPRLNAPVRASTLRNRGVTRAPRRQM